MQGQAIFVILYTVFKSRNRKYRKNCKMADRFATGRLRSACRSTHLQGGTKFSTIKMVCFYGYTIFMVENFVPPCNPLVDLPALRRRPVANLSAIFQFFLYFRFRDLNIKNHKDRLFLRALLSRLHDFIIAFGTMFYEHEIVDNYSSTTISQRLNSLNESTNKIKAHYEDRFAERGALPP